MASSSARLIRKVLIGLFAGLGLLVLERVGALDQLTGGALGPGFDWNNDYQLVEHLRTVVVRRGLTHDAKDCLLFIVNGNDAPNAQRMQVMEKHSGTCPGPRGSLPRLFTLRVDRVSHTVETDSGSPDQFHPLP